MKDYEVLVKSRYEKYRSDARDEVYLKFYFDSEDEATTFKKLFISGATYNMSRCELTISKKEVQTVTQTSYVNIE